MFALTLAALFALLIAFAIIRFGFKRANTLFELGKYAIFTSLVALFLLVMGISFMFTSRMEREATTLPIITNVEQAMRSEADNRGILLAGRINQKNATALANDYVAYVEVATEGDDIERDLPDLVIDLRDGVVEVECCVYEQHNWHEARGTFERTEYLLRGDAVIIYGRGYLGQSVEDGNREDRLFISAPFIFRGDANEYQESLVPLLQRRATYAQIASTVNYLFAGIVLLSPLPRGIRLLARHGNS